MGEKYHYKEYAKSQKKKLAYKKQKGGVETRNTKRSLNDEIEESAEALSDINISDNELTPFEDDYLNKLWNEIKEQDSSEDESKEDSSNLDTFFKKRFKRRLKHIRANKPLIPTNIQESLKELDEKGMELKKMTEELEELEKEKHRQVPASQSRTQRRRAQRARRRQRDKKIILKEEIDEKDKILKEKIDEFSRILSKRDETETIIEGHLWEPAAGEKPIKITLDRNYESGPILVNIGQNLPPIELPTTGSNLYKYDSAIKVNVPVGAKAGDRIYINKSQIMMPNVPVTFADGMIHTPKKLVFEIQKKNWEDSKKTDSKYNIQKNVDQKALGFYDTHGYHGEKIMKLGPDTTEDAPFEKQINLEHLNILHNERVEKIKKEEKEKKEKEEGYEEEKKSKSYSPIPYTKFRPGSAKSFEKLNDKWRVQWSKTHNEPYYVNLDKKTSQWAPPPLIGQQPMGQPESEEKEKKEKDNSDENEEEKVDELAKRLLAARALAKSDPGAAARLARVALDLQLSPDDGEEKGPSLAARYHGVVADDLLPEGEAPEVYAATEKDDSDENDDGKEDFVSHRFEEDDLVEALYMDGNWYNAKIKSLEADGRYFIEWTDPRLRHGVSRSSKFTTIDDDELRPGQTLRPWSIRNDSLVPAVEKDDDDEGVPEMKKDDDEEDDEEDDESQESSSYSPSNVSSLTTTPVNNDDEDESQESSSYYPSDTSSLTTTPVKVAESSPL